jgi:glycosyltransferase involved in cell wall biosynthesis
LWQHRDQLDPELTSKLQVFRGALPINAVRCRLHQQFLERQREGLTLIYIGHDYFQKGGVPLLRAFLRLKDRLPELRLRIISRLRTGDFVTQSTPADAAREKLLLRSDPRIEWHESLPNAEVMERIVTSHVGILASLDDQQPLSVLECMSVGVPTIASAITAIPEAVTEGTTGWLLPLPTSENLRWTGLQAPQGSDERRRRVADAHEEMTRHLVDRISFLYDNAKVLQSMRQACITHVQSNHDPATQAMALRRIYDEALA